MPPKAKPRVRRPAARAPEGRMRRPAAALDVEADDGEGPKTFLADLGMAKLSKLGHIWLKKAVY